MVRLIDANAFERYVFDEWMNNELSNSDWIQFREWLRDQEPVVEYEGDLTKVVVRDVEYVPVIRCKDCKWYNQESGTCYNWASGAYDDHFCSTGERKES